MATGINVVITVTGDRIRGVGFDEERIQNYIANRLNDARNVFIRHMSGPAGRDPETRRSRPGEYPKTDTGRLANSVDFQVGHRAGQLYTDLEYAIHLAFGTRNMADRKMLSDALDEVMENRPAADELARALIVVKE